MLFFLHHYSPQPIFFSIGPFNIYWYGLFMVTGIAIAIIASLHLAKKYQINRDTIFDISFWLIVGGLLGARIYEVFLMLPFYARHPEQIIKVWEGGLAIHGAILGGIIMLLLLARQNRISFFKLGSLFVPGLALGQAIGRFGNYFNQELFGLPTTVPWGIPIDMVNRPLDYLNYTHFHPTFLYESIGCLIIGVYLFALNSWAYRKNRLNTRFYFNSVLLYVILYSGLRFSLEFIRLDETPLLWGWRWPQIASLIMIAASLLLLRNRHRYDQKTD